MELAGEERKKQIEFIRNIDQFFNGEYLSNCCAEAKVSSQLGGRYEGGVEIKGAKYVIHVGVGRYFVFIDFAGKIVDFRMIKEIAPSKFGVVSIGTIKVGEIDSDDGKKTFAKQIEEFMHGVREKSSGLIKK